MVLHANDHATALFWVRIASFSAITLPIAVHFVLIYTEWSKKIPYHKLIMLALYVITFFFSLYVSFSDQIFDGVIKTTWGYTVSLAPASFIRNSFFGWLGGLGFSTVIMTFTFYFQAKRKKEKKQALYVALGCLTPVVLANISQAILPMMNFKIAALTGIGAAFQEIFIGYAILRYDLFALTPVTAADNIVSTMSDLLILIRPDGRIVSVNRAVNRMLGYREEELFRVPATRILPGNLVRQIINNKETQSRLQLEGLSESGEGIETTLRKKDDSEIPASVVVSVLKEKNGSRAGFIVIARDFTKKKQAEVHYLNGVKHFLNEELQKITFLN